MLPSMPYGELHANEPEILVKEGRFTPMEAIQSCTKENAFVMGLDGKVGTIEEGMMADIILLDADPIADISVSAGWQARHHGHEGRRGGGPEQSQPEQRAVGFQFRSLSRRSQRLWAERG